LSTGHCEKANTRIITRLTRGINNSRENQAEYPALGRIFAAATMRMMTNNNSMRTKPPPALLAADRIIFHHLFADAHSSRARGGCEPLVRA
jgi:hypothetical protein